MARFDMDPLESHRWVERQHDLAHYEEERLERRGRFEPAPLLWCPLCFKDLAAREDCAVCSDEDVAA